jgi:hypothetical protein
MAKNSTPQLTVVYPGTELRGQASKHLRTWTHDQTLARDQYRVVAAFADTDHSIEREIEPLLGPSDELVSVPNANTPAILNTGAARAGTPWLVFTEGHCLADPGCLEAVVRWIEKHPNAEVGNFSLTHNEDTLLDRLSTRWYSMILTRWRAPDYWPRVIIGGFAIRTDVFEAVGGFEPEYGLFASALMSARLHARGAKIEVIPGASVIHVDVERMSGHHESTARYAVGEFEARSHIDAVFMERYFGHSELWANQFREHPRTAMTMAQAVFAAGIAHPKRSLGLVAALRPLAIAAIAGIGLRVAINRMAVILDELAIEYLPLPAKLRWSRFNRAHARTVHLTRLKWTGRQSAPPTRPLLFQQWPIDTLDPDKIIGVHGLEEYRGHRFRWTEPVVLIRLAPSEDDYEIRIQTAGIRGNPLTAVIAVVVGGRVMPRSLLTSDNDGTLVVQLPTPWPAAARAGIILVFSALVPARAGVPDQRHLGLPIVSIASAPLQSAQKRGVAA